MSATAQTVIAETHSDALSPELQASVALMFGPGANLAVERAGKRTVVRNEIGQGERVFAALPSTASPRWLVPLGAGKATTSALSNVRVFAPGAKVRKAAVQIAASLGLLPKIAQQFVISGDQSLSLFEKLKIVTAQRDPVVSVTFGTPGKFRKLTVAVMSASGVPVAFVKVPMTQEARTRIEHEGELLNVLSGTSLAGFVPRVLFAGEWNGQQALCITAGPEQSSPMQFGAPHWKLLQSFWAVRPASRSGEQVVAEVSAQIASLGPAFESMDVLRSALQYVAKELKGTEVACGLSHGDFAPWNLRSLGDRLFAFDWESASWDQPNLWDVAHFDTQMVTLLGRKSRYRDITRGMAGAKPLYLLYLVKSTADAAHEAGECSTQVKDRIRLLSSAIQD